MHCATLPIDWSRVSSTTLSIVRSDAISISLIASRSSLPAALEAEIFYRVGLRSLTPIASESIRRNDHRAARGVGMGLRPPTGRMWAAQSLLGTCHSRRVSRSKSLAASQEVRAVMAS
eukprot:CAMPEP_0182839902 /NCGR_PEP_ID=MMETSP0006_2-20121128/24129_1 /TAXON_ID=97485 /ORGANISM="Prymnesium parvum, Strain Texoma1" /LENGTH=117 /DNA_ID=CAMNT_0024969113 /DNA_START=20 /DNA_END=373 /DNA_ORIENTATION=-